MDCGTNLVTLSRQKNISDIFLPVSIGEANNVYQDQPAISGLRVQSYLGFTGCKNAFCQQLKFEFSEHFPEEIDFEYLVNILFYTLSNQIK